MAKLYLKYEQAVLKEFPLGEGVLTIGRLPDNSIQVDNLAVSGHHAKIYWDGAQYAIEDNNSLNGTFVNHNRVSKAVLKDGDEVLIGKHTLRFQDGAQAGAAVQAASAAAPPPVPAMEATVVLDTRKQKDRLGASGPATRERVGTLIVLQGKTDQQRYVLSGKLTVIGKSEMASVKLKGWFAPKVAAVINKRDNKYFIAASEKDVKVKVSGAQIAGQHELTEGDLIEVAGVKATFGFAE